MASAPPAACGSASALAACRGWSASAPPAACGSASAPAAGGGWSASALAAGGGWSASAPAAGDGKGAGSSASLSSTGGGRFFQYCKIAEWKFSSSELKTRVYWRMSRWNRLDLFGFSNASSALRTHSGNTSMIASAMILESKLFSRSDRKFFIYSRVKSFAWSRFLQKSSKSDLLSSSASYCSAAFLSMFTHLSFILTLSSGVSAASGSSCNFNPKSQMLFFCRRD